MPNLLLKAGSASRSEQVTQGFIQEGLRKLPRTKTAQPLRATWSTARHGRGMGIFITSSLNCVPQRTGGGVELVCHNIMVLVLATSILSSVLLLLLSQLPSYSSRPCGKLDQFLPDCLIKLSGFNC